MSEHDLIRKTGAHPSGSSYDSCLPLRLAEAGARHAASTPADAMGGRENLPLRLLSPSTEHIRDWGRIGRVPAAHGEAAPRAKAFPHIARGRGRPHRPAR